MNIREINNVQESVTNDLILLGLDGLPIVRFTATCDDCGFVVATPHDMKEIGDKYNDLIVARSNYHTQISGHEKFSINHATYNLLKCYVCDHDFVDPPVSQWGTVADLHYKDTGHAFYIACENPDWK